MPTEIETLLASNRRIEDKIDAQNDKITDLSIQLGKFDAYDVPGLVDDLKSTDTRLVQLETSVHTWAAVAGAFGTMFGAVGLEGIKRWLSSL